VSWGPAQAFPWRAVRSAPRGTSRAWERGIDGRAHWYRYRLELLECGHRLRLPPKAPRAARRRCRQCLATTVDVGGRRHVPTVRLGAWLYCRRLDDGTPFGDTDRRPLHTFTSYPVPGR
jgi:hypothetical protein